MAMAQFKSRGWLFACAALFCMSPDHPRFALGDEPASSQPASAATTQTADESQEEAKPETQSEDSDLLAAKQAALKSLGKRTTSAPTSQPVDPNSVAERLRRLREKAAASAAGKPAQNHPPAEKQLSPGLPKPGRNGPARPGAAKGPGAEAASPQAAPQTQAPVNPPATATPVMPPPAVGSEKDESAQAAGEETTTQPGPITSSLTTLTFTVAPVDPEGRSYRFDYFNTPWADVLADFARMSGLSFLNQPDPPISETLTFRSPRELTYAEALAQLNELLTSRPLNRYLIRRQENYLVIKRLPDWMREISPAKMFDSFEAMEASNPDPFDIVMVLMDVPEGWTPYDIIEEYRHLFSDTYGTQVSGDRLELTGLVQEHRRFHEVILKQTGMTPTPPQDDPRPMHNIQMKNARVADVQTILRQIYPVSAPTPTRGPGIDPKQDTANRIDIIADVRNNILMIKAPPKKLAEITTMAEKLDTGAGPSLPEMKVMRLQYADATQLAGMLKPIFMKEQQALMKPENYISPEQRANIERDIFPDAANNSVVIVGGAEGVARAEDLVRQWDTPGENQINEIITLEHANADEVASVLSVIVPAAAKPGQPGDRITPRSSSSLMVSCSKRTFDQVLQLIEKLDVPADDEEKEHLVQPEGASPSALGAVLQAAFSGGAGPRVAAGKRQPTAPQASPAGPGPRFIPDDASGYLIIYCIDKDWERIEPLIAKLDSRAVFFEPKLRAFPLKNARADDVVNMLQQMFPPGPATPGQPVRPAQQTFFADAYNNTLSVFASEEFLEKITPFITDLDIASTGKLTVIRLAHADAEQVAPILAAAVGGAETPRPAQPRRIVQQAGQAAAQVPAAPVSSEGGAVRIIPEPITNSLLVTAPERELAEIQSLVANMEIEAEKAAEEGEPTRVILAARHRSAEEIVATLTSLSTAPSVQLAKTGSKRIAQAGAPTQAPTMKIVASGKQIILDGPRDEVAKAIQLVEQIDVPHDQPMFRKYQVLDAEEDEKKLRTMMAMSPATPAAPAGAKGKPAPSTASPESIQIYADTYESTLLVGASLESQFDEVERILALIIEDPRRVPGDTSDEGPQLPFFLIKLKHKKAYDIKYDLEDILNPDDKSNGLKFDEGPTERTLMVLNCKPPEREKVEEVVKMFDVPERGAYGKNVRTIDTEMMPPDMIIRVLDEQTNIPMKIIPMGQEAGRVQIIDIHAADDEPEPDAKPDEKTEATDDESDAQPCVLPATMLCALHALPFGQAAPVAQDGSLDPAVCPICHQSPCILPAELLKSLDAVALGGFDEEPKKGSDGQATLEFSDRQPRHNHPQARANDEDAEEPEEVTIIHDSETGKIILKGPEELLDEIEEIIEEIVGGDQPTVFRVFPLKYAEVTSAAQLLEQVFNQGQAAATGARGRQAPPIVPQQPPQQPEGQPGQAGKGGPQQKQQQPQAPPPPPARIKVVPDPRTKSLFVAAPLSDVPLIIEVLKKIDARVKPGEQNIRYFRLVNLDADEVVETLQEVLGIGGQGFQGGGPNRGRPQRPGQPGQQQAQQEQMIQLQAQQGGTGAVVSAEQISLSAEEQTNTIIARAPLDTLALIEGLIKELDQDVPNTMKTEMRRIPLVNAQSSSVATIVKDVVSNITGRGERGTGRGSISGRVSVNADPRTNSVILGGQKKDIDVVVGIVRDMDVAETNGAKIRQFTVKGDPASMSTVLKAMFAAGKETDIVITGDASTSTLMVKAPPQQMEEIAQQIALMEEKVAGEKELKTIKLMVADPEQIAPKLQEIFAATRGAGGAKQTITIKGSKANNTLYIMGADEEAFDSIRQVAGGMDTQPSGIQVRRFGLKFASAVEINQQLTDMMVKAKATGGLEDVKLDLIGVVPDARTNSLIVTGGPITFLLIDDVLKAVDVEPPAGIARETRSYQLPLSIDVNQVLANINVLFAAQQAQKSGLEMPSVTANAASNLVMIVANAAQHDMIKSAVIDPIMAAAGGPFEDYRIPLKFINAEATRVILEDFLNKWKISRGNKPQDAFALTSAEGTNMLLVNCSPQTKALIDKQLAEMDVQTGVPETRFVVLRHAKADEAARVMNDTFRLKTSANPRGLYPVTITPDTSTNTLMVTAPTHMFGEVDAMVAALDQAGEGVRKEHTIELANTDAADVARSLQQIYNAGVQGRQGRTAPTIQDVPGTTKLIALANDTEIEQIRALVRQIDVEGSTGRIVHTVTMPELIPAKSVADTINELYAAPAGREGVKANYHEPTNTLLVSATGSEFARIKEQVIDKVTTTPTIGALKIFRIPLKYAVADEVAKTLQTFFDKKSGVKTAGSGLPPWMRGNEAPAKQIDNQVSIVAEPSSNMLLVYCTDATKELIDEIIADIDSDPSGTNVMEMVTLKYVDAAEMIDILTEYLKVSKRSSEGENEEFVPWWMERRQTKEDKAVLAGDMRLKAIESLNAIVVVGKAEGVADALAKIKELDVERTDSGEVPQTIRLAHATASDLADKLTRVFNDQAFIKSKGASYIPPVIVAEDTTNSLIVRGKTSDFNMIKKMAESLDSQMEGEASGGVRVIAVPSGRDLEMLAKNVEQRINDAESNRQKLQKDYKPDLVSIGADLQAGALLVAGSKGKYEEVKAIVNELVAMAPSGGRARTVIQLKNLTGEEVRKLIDEIQQGSTGGAGSRGPRGDAAWPRDRRYHRSPRAIAPTGSLPVIMMHLALGAAVAQTTTSQAEPQRQEPVINTVRPRQPTTQPSRQRLDPEEMIKAAAQQGRLDASQMTDAAKAAFGRKLSGAPIAIADAGMDSVVIDATEEDLEVIVSILEMLDQALPGKVIEYVALKKASSQDLARTLADVFSKVEQKGQRQVRPEDKVDIIADPRTNGLYIAATAEKMKQVMGLIEQNEEAAGQILKQVQTFAFKNRRVSEVGEVLKKMVATYLSQKGLDPKLIGVEIDPQTNSIFITANETDLEFVTKIIDGLDAEVPPAKEGETPMGEADVMVVPLRIAQADTLGTLLNELLQKAATGDTPLKDFIRRFHLLDAEGRPLATVNLDRPIVIFGEKDSNSLIIASTKQNCLIMKQVAMAFDREPARAEVQYQVFSIKNADATEVADQLNKLLTDGENLTARPGKGDKSGVPDGAAGSIVYKAVVAADARTNQLVLVARPEAMTVLSDLVTRLDVKGLDVMPFTLVRLEYASVSALEKALTDMMKERADALPKGTGPNAGKSETVIIKGDPRSKSLIIAAKAGRLEELKALIAQLDIPSSALIEDIRTITLKNTSATDLAEKLKSLWDQRQQQQDGGSGSFKLETPAIVADERSNSLIVAASRGDFDAIKSVVEKIEALELNPMANIYVLRLKYNSAKQLQTAFTALFKKRAEMRTVDGKVRPEDEVAIEVDEASNALLFAGSRENYDVLVQKVQELDQEIGVPGVVEFFVCNNVGAHRVKETIDELFKEGGVYKPGASSESELAKTREKVTVSVDDRANMLLVSASPENMELIREIYKRMNSVTTPWDVAITRMLIIEHGDSVKIAAQVADYFKKLDEVREQSKGEGAGKGGFGITVFADERSNRIVIGGTKDGIDSAVELVKRLDVPPGTPGQLAEVYLLKEAPAAAIGEMIKNVFAERNKPRQGGEGAGVQVPSVTVTVEPNGATNSLLINASREDHILIKDLIARLDRTSTLMEMTRVIPLERAPAARVKEILDELYQSGEGGDGAAAKSIGVVEDKRTNSVVVSAPPGELDNIAAFVKRLDETEVKGQAEVGVFICENEDAEKMSELLNEIMTGQAREGGGGGGTSAAEGEGAREISSMLISFATKDEAGRQLFLKTIRENVQITFNERTNSIIAVAPPTSLRLIEQLVQKLDQIQKRSVLVKVFLLQNADATKMVELLEGMFAQEEGAEEEAAFQRGREIEVEGGGTSSTGVPTALSQGGEARRGTFGRPKTTFTADERTNAIIVAGWPEDIDVVADMIDQLDSRAVQDRENIVYTLTNQVADDVQAALDEYFQAEIARMDALSETLSPQRRMEQEVSVISHPASNQLILSVSPRYKEQVLSIIEQLDMAPPQVMIQVFIAEVTLDDRFEMGLEFALQELRFSETAVADPNGILQSSHFDVVGGTDLGAAGSGLGGFSFTITGEDFNFLVRALQSDSRLEVIQRPMIMCQDNQQATIQIGQSVPTPSGAQTFGGQTSTQVQYNDVGVILNVEPHINPDGFVYLLVEPEISSVTDSTIQIAPGAFAPVFNRRRATTYVAVMDGETVVIGGLITTTENESESKVPFLGDVPGLGLLFRTTIRTKNRTELLIALTPKVVRTVEDGRRISIAKRDESGIITDNIKQSVLLEGLRVQPETAGEVESLETPPLYEQVPLPPGMQTPVETELQPQYGPEAPKYGPEVPKYGPLSPTGDGTVALRQRPPATTQERMIGAGR